MEELIDVKLSIKDFLKTIEVPFEVKKVPNPEAYIYVRATDQKW